MKTTFIAGLIGLGLTPCLMAESASLKLKWEPGTIYTTQQVQKGDITMPEALGGMKVASLMNMTTVNSAAKHAEGVSVATKYSEIKFTTTMGGQELMSFDSAKNDQAGPIADAFKPLMALKMSSVYDGNGKLLRIEGADDFVGNAQAGLDKATLENMVKQSSLLVPQKDVEVGGTWDAKMAMPLGKMAKGEVTMNFKMKLDSVVEKEGKKLALVNYTGSVDGNIGEEGEQLKVEAKDIQGSYEFDLGLGQISTSTMKMAFTIGMPQGGGGEMNGVTTNTQTLLKVEKK